MSDLEGRSAIPVDSMYHRCIDPRSTGLCRPVRTVPARPDITPARSLRSDENRHRTTHPDNPVFRFWEQEAESSNLSIPTTSTSRPRSDRSADVSAMYQMFSRSMSSVTVSTVVACGLVGFGCTAGSSFSLGSFPRGLGPDRDGENDLASLIRRPYSPSFVTSCPGGPHATGWPARSARP